MESFVTSKPIIWTATLTANPHVLAHGKRASTDLGGFGHARFRRAQQRLRI
jgi:hypothetical protein